MQLIKPQPQLFLYGVHGPLHVLLAGHKMAAGKNGELIHILRSPLHAEDQ